jgi:hypothetical protein
MVERGHLGDHPADADPREVRGPAAERVGKGRRVGGEVAQGVGGASGSASSTRRYRAGRSAPRGARRRRGARKRVGPGEHRRSAREQDEWCVVVTERLDAQGT